MPDVSIAVSARDNYSRAIERMSAETDTLDKNVEELVRNIRTLNRDKVSVKAELDDAKKELKEAQKNLDETAESVEKLNNAQLNVDFLTDELREISKAAKNARDDLVDVDGQVSKSKASGSIGGSRNQDLFDRLATAGAFSQIGDVASQIVGSYVSSAYGSQAGTMFGSVLSGAGSGAAIGSMIAPGVGTAVGAGVGALVGAVSGANNIYQERDDAFKSYVQEQVEGQLSKQEEMRASGSTIAGKRETDLISFTTLFDKNKELAERYLKDVRTLSNTTPFLYDDLTSMSKVLKTYGFQVGNMIPTLTKIGDAGAALGMETQDMNAIATALGRMYMGGNATREDLDIMNDRGINAVQYLADAYGVGYSKMLEKISGGEVLGKRAVEIILEGMEKSFKGAMADQSTTFEGLTSTLEGWNQELEAAMGEGYNAGRKIGMKNQIDFLSGETGAAMQEAYNQIGAFQADLENQREQMQRDALNAVMKGVMPTEGFEEQKERLKELAQEYADAAQTAASSAQGSEEQMQARADMGRALAEAQVIAENEYNASEGAQIVLEGQMALANQVAADTSLDSKYWDAGYRLGAQYSKGIAAGMAENMPQVDSIGIVSGATASNRGSTYGGTSSANWRGSTVRRRAFGLNRVPYDDYPAMLHEGERVLTANQARQADAGGGVGEVNVNLYGMTVREDADVTRIAREIVSELQIAMAARKG